MNIEREAVRYEEMMSKEEVLERVNELGSQIAEDYQGREQGLIVVGVLKGAYVFMGMLTQSMYRAGNTDHKIEFVSASSYGGNLNSNENPDIRGVLDLKVGGKDVLLVEDVIDNGFTLSKVLDYLEQQGPASVAICVLVEKLEKNKTGINADYVGFYLDGDFWLEGVGMDSMEVGRARDNIVVRTVVDPLGK